jgi:tripeptidyl-peptidase-1
MTSVLVFLAIASALVTFEKPAVPAGWTLQGAAKSEARMTLYFFVPFRPGLEEELVLRSSPKNKLFRQWLSHEQVTARFVDRAALETVRRWLAPLGPSVEGTNVVKVRVTAGRAAQLLHTRFGQFSHGQHSVLRATSSYSLPEHIAPLVAFVGGVHQFPTFRRARVRTSQTKAGLAITPRIIRERYGTGDARSKAAGNSQSVAQFLGQFFWETDLQEFFTLYSRDMIGSRPVKVGPDAGAAGIEASLDIEYIMSVGRGVKTYFWSTPGLHDQQEPFLEWVINVTSSASPPLINSV